MLTLEDPRGIMYEHCAKRLGVVGFETLDHEFYRCIILAMANKSDTENFECNLGL